MQAIIRCVGRMGRLVARISLEEACRRINKLEWSNSDPRWQQVLLHGDRVLAGRTAVRFASQVIAYWLGEKLSDDQISDLQDRYTRQSGVGKLEVLSLS